MKKAALLFTGGKDSCLALLRAKENGFDVKYLLSIIPSSFDSYMYHKPSLLLLKAQARMLSIPLLTKKSRAGKERELKDLEALIKRVSKKVDYLVIGGIASNYQAKRIKKIAEKQKLKILAPLWNYSAKQLWHELLENNLKVVITKISCEGLGKEWLGKIIDKKAFEELMTLSKKYKFELSGEGGDFETAVLFMPLFSREIKIKCKSRSQGSYRHFFVVEKVF